MQHGGGGGGGSKGRGRGRDLIDAMCVYSQMYFSFLPLRVSGCGWAWPSLLEGMGGSLVIVLSSYSRDYSSHCANDDDDDDDWWCWWWWWASETHTHIYTHQYVHIHTSFHCLPIYLHTHTSTHLSSFVQDVLRCPPPPPPPLVHLRARPSPCHALVRW